MNTEVFIKQKKLGHYREFRFLDGQLAYKVKDLTGERTFNVPYEAIDMPNGSDVRTKNPRCSHQLYRAATVGLVAAFLIGRVNTTAGGIVCFVALASYVGIWIAQTLGWLSVDLTHIPLHAPKAGTPKIISVIGDRYREQVTKELTDRWRKRVRILFGTANLNADPEQETRRLRHLRDLQVISAGECEEQIQRMSASAKPDLTRRYLN
ncbi:hypothetical protein [Rhizobium sp. SG741]|uniref:hypothetical protein n=1 Tax=Rhizobium sp. SG741 TaxID=2587114 RepID=UPI0014475CB4|nr:hypothetical protein [Rhizobium sp. SG741]NKJ08975.1 hypothetical protein [Rhizobium sp. SG741]